jgi:hypothetical protein
MTIYVVMGMCGEYSDRTEWPVKAFVNKEKGKALVENATRRSAELQLVREQEPYVHDEEIAKQNQFDPGMKFDYTGTRYYLMPVDLSDAV